MRLCGGCGGALAGADWVCTACRWRAPAHQGFPNLLDDTAPVAGGFTEIHAHDLVSIDPAHFWFAARNRLITWAVGTYAPEARTFLDVGCGTGPVLRALASARPDLRLTGTDVSVDMLHQAAKAAPGAELLRADIRHLPYDQEFDVVGAFDTLEHIPDHAEALAAAVRATRRGGTVVITVPQHRALWSPIDDYSGHQRRYARGELVALAREAGLQVVRVTSFVSLLLPAMLLSRLAQRGAEVVPDREFRMSARVNGVATRVMQAELGLIKAGMSLPAGGSLLLVGRRS